MKEQKKQRVMKVLEISIQIIFTIAFLFAGFFIVEKFLYQIVTDDDITVLKDGLLNGNEVAISLNKKAALLLMLGAIIPYVCYRVITWFSSIELKGIRKLFKRVKEGTQ